MGLIKKICHKLLRIATFPARQASLNHMLNYGKARPLDINIETTTFCPLKCKFCCNRLYTRTKTIMDMDVFEKIINDYTMIVGGGTLGIGSMQSDFLSDPLLLQRVETLKKFKDRLYVHSTTPLITATKYSDDELYQIFSCFDFLEISVEGFDKKSYKLMCGVDAYDVLVTQLVRLRELIKVNNLKLDVLLSFRTYDRARMLESDVYKQFQNVFRIGEIKTAFFSWFGSIKESDLPGGATLYKSDNSNKNEDCVVPHATLAIQANGNVVGCGCIDWLESHVIGNINQNSLLEIWQSEPARKFRHAFSHGTGQLPEICKECGLYTPISVFARPSLKNYTSMDGLYYTK